MKRKKTIAILSILTILIVAWSIRYFSFTGSYIAWFKGTEPLGGGSYVLRIRTDGTGVIGQSPESNRPFTYRRNNKQLEIEIDWDYPRTNVYVFEIEPMRLVSLGHKLADGNLTKESGYGFLMRGTYHKRIY